MKLKPWFLLFTLPLCADLSLSDAEEVALSHNKHYLIVQENTVQSRERKNQAISRFLPKIEYQAEFRGAQRPEGFFNIFDPRQPFSFSAKAYRSTLQLDQTIFSTDLIFGYLARDMENQVVQMEQAQTKNELLRAVRQRYYGVVYFENALQIWKENIDYLSYALRQEEGKLQAGSSTILEVSQSKVAVANAISQYYETLKELKNARNALVLTLGIDPLLEPTLRLSQHQIPLRSIPEIAKRINELEEQKEWCFSEHLTLFTEQDSHRYLDQALTYRPEIKAARLSIGVAEKQVRSKQGHYLPKVSGFVRFAYNDNDPGIRSYGSQPYNWTGGIQLSWNLFDGMLREHEIREAKSVRAAARIGFDKQLQRIEVEVRNDLYLFEETLLAYYAASEAVALAQLAREQAQERLEFGRIPPLSYRDAVNQLAQARNRYNRASFDLIAAYYDLRYATGEDTSSTSKRNDCRDQELQGIRAAAATAFLSQHSDDLKGSSTSL